MSAQQASSNWLPKIVILLLAAVGAALCLYKAPGPVGEAVRRVVRKPTAARPAQTTPVNQDAPAADQAPVPRGDAPIPAEARAQLDAPTGPDPYAWLAEPAPGAPVPQLNIALDFTRFFGAGFLQTEKYIRENAFRDVSAPMFFKPVYLELVADELENANVFVVPRANGRAYSPAEKKVLEDFLKRGGVVLYWDDAVSLGRDLLKSQGAKTSFFETRASAGISCRVPAWEGMALEESDYRDCHVVDTSSSAGWVPVVERQPGQAYLAYREVGKGVLVYASRRILWGRHENGEKMYNRELFGRFFAACARRARTIDGTRPFRMRELQSAPVQLTSQDIHLYAAESRRSEAEAVKRYLDRMLPELRNLTGVARLRVDNWPLDRLDFVIGERNNSWCNFLRQGNRLVRMHSFLDETHLFTHKCGGGGAAYLWRPAGFDTQHWNHGFQSFDCCFQTYVHYLLMERLGYEDKTRSNFRDILDWWKDRDVVHRYWNDGTPRDTTLESITDYGQLIALNRAKLFTLMETLRAEKPDIVRALCQTLEKLAEQGRVKGAADIHQTAAIFSRAMGRDLFPLFEELGYRVDRRKARFGRPERKAHELAPVAGKPALPEKKFMLGKGEGGKSDIALELVGCPAGTARMGRGTGANGPDWGHVVAVSEDFYLGKFPVTKGQWAAVMGDRSRGRQEQVLAATLGGWNAAADHLSYSNVLEFCTKLTKMFQWQIPSGYVFRPPTELEWEYACRAGAQEGPYAGTGPLTLDEEKALCWTPDDALAHLRKKFAKPPKDLDAADFPLGPVGQKKANAWGLHDMFGMGWEYCLDTFSPLPGLSPAGMASREALAKLFTYRTAEKENVDFLFSYDGPGAYVCARGLDYRADGCGKTVVPVDGPPAARMSFRVCLGPELK